jgi:Ca-activated chloride channel family protein
MNFNSPVWLLALIPVALLLLAYLVLQLRRKKYVAKFSNLQLLGSVAPKRPGWRRHLTFVLLVGGLAVLALGVAEPTADVRVPRDNATVILAIDVSLSMEATDVLPNRLEAAKTAAKTFVGLLPKRINLGVVSFAGTASLLVPPTLDRTAATRAVEGLQLRESTAIGEAIFTGLDAIAAFNQQTASEGGEPPPARIVLLSDGTNTVGREPLPEAVPAAQKAHVEVSTIAFGTDSGTVTNQGETIPVPSDKQTLAAIAAKTGGTFHTATSVEELKKVYDNIGSQIGYTTQNKIISWRFMVAGLLVLLVAGASSLLWAGRLI